MTTDHNDEEREMQRASAIRDEYDDQGQEVFYAKTLAQIGALPVADETRQAMQDYFEKLAKAESIGHMPTMPPAVNSALNTGLGSDDPAVKDQFQEVMLRIGLVLQCFATCPHQSCPCLNCKTLDLI